MGNRGVKQIAVLLMLFININVQADEIINTVKYKGVLNVIKEDANNKRFIERENKDFIFHVHQSGEQYYFTSNVDNRDYTGQVSNILSNVKYTNSTDVDFQIRIIGNAYTPSNHLYRYSFLNAAGSEPYYKNFIAFTSSQQDNRNYDFFLRYDYSKSQEKVYLQGVYYNVYLENRDCDNMIKAKVDIDLKALPFYYLENMTRKEISLFFINLHKNSNYLPLKAFERTEKFTGEEMCSLEFDSNESRFTSLQGEIKSRKRHKSSDEYTFNQSCPDNGETVFECRLENKKIVRICQGEQLSYQYGTNRHIELKYPNKKNDDGIVLTESKNKGVTKSLYSFEINKFKYQLNSTTYVSNPYFKLATLSASKNEKTIFNKYCIRE